MDKLKNFVSKDGEYIIPVEWAVYGNVIVSGCNNLKEAYECVKKYIDDIPLSDSPEYVDGSYKINDEDGEDYLIYAQSFNKHVGPAYFRNPDNRED